MLYYTDNKERNKGMYIKAITLRPCSGAGPRDSNSRPRVYIGIDGETLMQNLQNRRDRPYTIYKKEVLPTLFRKLGLNPKKVGWSQKAGCTMCPCSPGFIVQSRDIPYDIHVTITDKWVSEVEINGSIR